VIGLIGSTGFVGSHLAEQISIDKFFNSKNISDLGNYSFDILICAGMRGVKWKANKYPAMDSKNLSILQSSLMKTKAKKLILISTVDVFSKPECVNENSIAAQAGDNYYGKNRYNLEQFISSNFNSYFICRLSGLVGENLKKNFLYDLKHNNELHKFNPESSFQFYPISNLWSDINIALNNNIKLAHFSSQPMSVYEISRKFNYDIQNFSKKNKKIIYDMQTIHSQIYNQHSDYLYTKNTINDQIKNYLKK
jgi:hypothetical protein